MIAPRIRGEEQWLALPLSRKVAGNAMLKLGTFRKSDGIEDRIRQLRAELP